MEILLEWHRARRIGDLPDRWKDLLDALQAKDNHGFGPYVDDKQITKITMVRFDKLEAACVRLEVKECGILQPYLKK